MSNSAKRNVALMWIAALVFAIFAYRGFTKPSVYTMPGVVSFTCVEFDAPGDTVQFLNTGVVPTNARVNNKPARECPGVPVESNH